MKTIPSLIELPNQKQYRIISSVYPPINFFEDLVDPAEMETLFEIESMTNERLRQETGDIFLIAENDRVCGSGSSVVMAAFTHIGRPSRFTDGSYGIYYAGLTLETAIRETVFHRENFLRATNEEPGEITMRVYEGRITKPLHDIRGNKFDNLYHPDDRIESQRYGKAIREKNSWGVIYNSIRHTDGICIAAFRPPAVSIPKQTLHLKYHWNGVQIAAVSSTKILMEFE